MLSTVLECCLLVVQLLLEFSDILLQGSRFVRQPLVERIDRYCDEHLADAFIDWIVLRERLELAGSQLIQSCFSLFTPNLCLRLCDFLL